MTFAGSESRSCQFILTCILLIGNAVSFSAHSGTDFDALFAQTASSNELTQLSKQLAPSSQAKGLFTQYRHLKVLKKPLVSKGSFVFSKQLGVIWQQQSPFNSTLILQAGRLTQIDSQGQVHISDAQQSTTANQLSQLMPTLLNALLSGDLHTLEQHFQLSLQSASADNEQWQLGLTPIDPLVKKAIPRLVLMGEKQIQTLILFSDNQDSSRIEFSAINEMPLTEQDKARFSPAQEDSSRETR
ncbi:outer membrane lipoprotein carrier protein LolA [Shewanella sp. Choline-02u-19]|uniref:outer membrane lipoprotein carrier protein LolA n=1 Tax=unclassified Shewanella TaxID=196818 RepID=UPI000C343EDF|nr:MULTISPECIES: outer membrane lipoprotein carrier protein LolA [unclassified Shewanella]PKG55491.1 outer membrane lipoprotein carrier protein LolA [Shewanella sp. GutDb-MelDb]PKH60058.1 outer membrane lipoprotein carrier protein LolA [Shewanella sp. Bg11-22]PKI29216.1 outer membrane lipoprotein carrier protein LolA [Shewanella sp. Choline-02u-19]